MTATQDGTVVDAARRDAAEAAHRAEVDIRELMSVEDLEEVSQVLGRIWGDESASPMVSVEVLRAVATANSYLVGAYVAGELVGTALAFHDEPAKRTLHSYMTGVVASHAGRSLGFAMKLHQRAWCLERGIRTIKWTADPLVARNAHFNLVKLGASIVGYRVDYYGPMTDPVNQGDESDRVLLEWDLSQGMGAPSTTQRGVRAGSTDEVIPVPPDIESMRREDPAAAMSWRRQIRETLGGALESGGEVVGFDRARGYLVRAEPRERRGKP